MRRCEPGRAEPSQGPVCLAMPCQGRVSGVGPDSEAVWQVKERGSGPRSRAGAGTGRAGTGARESDLLSMTYANVFEGPW